MPSSPPKTDNGTLILTEFCENEMGRVATNSLVTVFCTSTTDVERRELKKTEYSIPCGKPPGFPVVGSRSVSMSNQMRDWPDAESLVETPQRAVVGCV